MARESRLYYWDIPNTRWFYVGNPDTSGVVNDSSASALKELIVTDKLGLPRKAEMFVTNKARNLLSTDVGKRIGYYDNVFKNFAKVIVVDEETHQIIYSGFVHKIDRRVNMEEGSVLRLECFDLLQDLRMMSGIDDKHRFWYPKKGDTFNGETNDGTNPEPGILSEVSHSKWMQRMLNTSLVGDESYRKLGRAIIDDFDDAGNNGTIQSIHRAEQSAGSLTTGQVNRHLTSSSLSILGHMREVSSQDPHTNLEIISNESRTFATREFGYDYFVDPNMTIPKPDTIGNWTHNPNQHFNYFQRGSRPNIEPTNVGLNVIFPTSSDTFDKGVRPGTNPYQKATRIMASGYSFEDLNDSIHTHARVVYSQQLDGHTNAVMAKFNTQDEQIASLNQIEVELLYVYNVRGGNPSGIGSTFDQDFYWRGTAMHNSPATPDFPVQKWFRPDWVANSLDTNDPSYSGQRTGSNGRVDASTTWYQADCDLLNGDGWGQTGKLCPWSMNSDHEWFDQSVSPQIGVAVQPPEKSSGGEATVMWSPSVEEVEKVFKYSYPRKVTGGSHPNHTWEYDPNPSYWGDPDNATINGAMLAGTPMSAEPLELWTTTNENSTQSGSSDASMSGYTFQGIVGHVQFLEVEAANVNTGTATTEANKKIMMVSHNDVTQWYPTVASDGRVNRFEYDEIDFPNANTGSSSFAILRGRYSQATARIDLSAADVWTGVPQHYIGMKNILQVDVSPEMASFDLTASNATAKVKVRRDQVRQLAMSKMYKASKNIKTGQYDIQRFPYQWLEGRINTIESSGSGLHDVDKYITIRRIDDTSAINLSAYGIKVGDVVRFFGSDATMTTETAYGYISELNASNTASLHINFAAGTTVQNRYPNSQDYVKIYSQTRTGSTIRVENTLANIAGNHMLVEAEYREVSGSKRTTLKSIGEEDDRPYEATITRRYDPGARSYDVQKAAALHTSAIPKASVTPDFSGVFSTGTYSSGTLGDELTRIRWSSGILSIGSKVYNINAGNTYAALGNAELPDTESAMIPEEYMAFYIYFDPIESDTELQVRPAFKDFGSIKMFTPASHKFIIAWCRRGGPGDTRAEWARFNGAAGQVPNFIRFDGGDIIKVDSMSAALHRKGTQPFSWNGIIAPVNLGQANESVTQCTMSQTSGTNPIVSFADNTTALLETGSISHLNNITTAGTSYVYFDLTGFTKDANGQYGSTGTPVPVIRTADYAAVNTDVRGLLAIIDKSPNDPYSIAVQTFGTKVGNINADNIAANSITANAIATGALDATIITLNPNGFIQTSATVNDGSGTDQAGFIFKNDGLRGYNATGDEMFVLDPTTGKAKMLINGSMVDQSNLNDWDNVFSGTGQNLPTFGAHYGTSGTNLTIDASDTTLRNSALSLTIDANGIFTLGNGAGDATDNRNPELKRKIFRSTSVNSGPPSAPYSAGDWWVTHKLHSIAGQRGTNICVTDSDNSSPNAAHWQRISPPDSIMGQVDELKVDGAHLEANSVTAQTLVSNFTLSNVVIAGTGLLDTNGDGTGGGGLNGVALTSDGLYAQNNGVTHLHIPAGSATNRGYLIAGQGDGAVAINNRGVIINEGASLFSGLSWHYGGLSDSNRILTLSVKQDWAGYANGLNGSSTNNGALFGMNYYSDVGMLIANQSSTYTYSVIDWNLVGHYVGPLSGRAPNSNLPSNWFTLPTTGPGGTDKVLKTTTSGDGALDTPYTTVWADYHAHDAYTDLITNDLTVHGYIIDNSSTNSYIFLSNYYHDFVANNYVDNPDSAWRYMRGAARLTTSSQYGYVGINSTGSISYNLYVSGDAAKTSGGSSWDTVSDDRIKTDIADITNATTTLKLLTPKTYKYTAAYQSAIGVSDGTDVTTTQYGFIASNFGTVLPDYTNTTKLDVIKLADDTYEIGDFSPKVDGADALPEGSAIEIENIKTIDDSAIIPLLVASIKELEARIAALES